MFKAEISSASLFCDFVFRLTAVGQQSTHLSGSQRPRCDNINNLSEDKSPPRTEKCIWDIKGCWERGSLRLVAPKGAACAAAGVTPT